MSDAQLSLELIRFIQTTLPSYDAAVILVFISRFHDRTWTVDDVVGSMGMDTSAGPEVRRYVDHLVSAGVLEPAEGERFRLVAASEPARKMVDELRMAYDRRPVTLIRAIDSAARSKIQSFADAFKLKRDGE